MNTLMYKNVEFYKKTHLNLDVECVVLLNKKITEKEIDELMNYQKDGKKM